MTQIQPVETRDRGLAGGEQRIYRFNNNYGASVIQGPYTYGGPEGLFELGVIRFRGKKWELDYDTPITDDVIGYLTENDVQEKLRAIRDLPAAAADLGDVASGRVALPPTGGAS